MTRFDVKCSGCAWTTWAGSEEAAAEIARAHRCPNGPASCSVTERKEPRTYEVKRKDGKTVKVTVPESDSGRETEALATAALDLIREIEKRDGEGNLIPSHLYERLRRLASAALGG